jgi:hypothetical protein
LDSQSSNKNQKALVEIRGLFGLEAIQIISRKAFSLWLGIHSIELSKNTSQLKHDFPYHWYHPKG